MTERLHPVTRDALALSSGTIGGLIGNTSYVVIDAVQAQFFKFCNEHAGEFPTWVQAWHAFDRVRNDPEYVTVQGEGAPQYTFAPENKQLALL